MAKLITRIDDEWRKCIYEILPNIDEYWEPIGGTYESLKAIEVKIPGEDILFYPRSHQYKEGKKRIPWVTSIVWIIHKPWLLPWVAKSAMDYLLSVPYRDRTNDEIKRWCWIFNEKKQKACDVWHKVHEFAENTIKGIENNLDDIEDLKTTNGVLAFTQYVKEKQIKWIEVEKVVYSKKHHYIGRFDAIAEINWEKWLVDFKTSKQFYEMEMRLQTAAYVEAYNEMTGDNIDKRMIIRFDKDTWEYEVHTMDNVKRDFEHFLSALDLYNAKRFYS